jgi:hypothetical protein
MLQFGRSALLTFVLLGGSVCAAHAQTIQGCQGPDDTSGDGTAFVKIGHLCWTPGKTNVVAPYVRAADNHYADITHTLTTTRVGFPGKYAVVGFDKYGGGYGWSAKLTGFAGVNAGEETGLPGYGGGMLGSILDQMHHTQYNPIQAGTELDRASKP